MQHMSFDLAAAGVIAEIMANASRGLAATTTASASVTALNPAGADEISAHFALAFAAEGAQMLALNTSAQEELARAGEAFTKIASIYSAVDDSCAGTFA
ncbi:PE family protein [Mycobacterium simiae]|uniref:PE family protein n=1 Tax=Mycobacterium simiae TaxID=1784 RepID=A0A5B1BUV1_MYCSI|nr:PE family protein [Mycobacterium simiae]KAA1252126.1 PE family protein [Mycobacterium simiae]